MFETEPSGDEAGGVDVKAPAPAEAPSDANALSPIDAWLAQDGTGLHDDDKALCQSPVHRASLEDIALVCIGLAREGEVDAALGLARAILAEAEASNGSLADVPTERLAAVALLFLTEKRVDDAVALRNELLGVFKRFERPFPRVAQSYFFALQLICSHRNGIGNALAQFAAYDVLMHPEAEKLPQVYSRSGIHAPAFEAMARESNGLFEHLNINPYVETGGDPDLAKFVGGAVMCAAIAVIWILRFMGS